MVKCTYCGKEINKLPNRIKNFKYLFCSRKHYFAFRRENNYYPKTIDKTLFHKIIEISKLRGA